MFAMFQLLGLSKVCVCCVFVAMVELCSCLLCFGWHGCITFMFVMFLFSWLCFFSVCYVSVVMV